MAINLDFKAYAAQVKAEIDAMQLTRDEFRDLLEVSAPPPGWDDETAKQEMSDTLT